MEESKKHSAQLADERDKLKRESEQLQLHEKQLLEEKETQAQIYSHKVD